MHNPQSEQTICIACGFCCDGTIFSNATLQPGEKGNLPDKIEEKYFVRDGKEFFRLPCEYFSDKCTIYSKKKAIICSSYRCQLLNDFSKEKISEQKAIEIVNHAQSIRGELLEQYKKISGIAENICFRQLLLKLVTPPVSKTINEKQLMDFTFLTARCNIFEALLIRHFRSAKDFGDMMEAAEI